VASATWSRATKFGANKIIPHDDLRLTRVAAWQASASGSRYAKTSAAIAMRKNRLRVVFMVTEVAAPACHHTLQ
jgi:hypothetical protein